MAARKAKKDKSAAKKAPAEARGPGGGELFGLAALFVALGLCLALLSFKSEGGNWMGPVGAQLARALLGAVGVAGYVLALAALIVAGATLLGRLRRPSLLSIISVLAIVLGATVFADLITRGPAAFGYPAGGTLGLVVGGLLKAFAGPAGAALAGLALIAVGGMGLTRWSPRAALESLGGVARRAALRVQGEAEIKRAARAAARVREEELLEAARARRSEAERQRQEREAALVDRLEEKKRVAVLKAEAKAEERALKKIAAEEAAARAAQLKPADAVVEALDSPPPPPPPSGLPSELTPPPELEDAAEVIARLSVLPSEGAPEPPPPAPEPTQEADGLVIHERLPKAEIQEEPRQPSLPLEPEIEQQYELPPFHLLDHEGEAPEPADPVELKARATRLEEKLSTYGVEGKVVSIRPGPVVTTYEYEPAPGVRVAKIANLSDDIAMSMEAKQVRIVAPIPGRGVVGIELPNERRENVYLKEIIADDTFKKSSSLLTLGLGKDAEGRPQVENLAKMPHLLIAGTTGSGKSVGINTMIVSMLYKATPEQVKFIMIDPKMLELSLYQDIPHLLLPVVTDPKKASLALAWAVDEMERRYQLLSEAKVRNIDGFNRRMERLRKQRDADARRRIRAARLKKEQEEAKAAAEAELQASLAEELAEEASGSQILPPDLEVPADPPEVVEAELIEEEEGRRIYDPWPDEELPPHMAYIVVLIDEFADLMMVASKDVEASVQRLAQKARAAGIHVLLATQRPSTDVITGVIKNNFPARIAFQVASRHDSATILNTPGAERLLGRGDSLLYAAPRLTRVHGAFVSEEEVERVAEFWKGQAKPRYDESILQPRDEGGGDFDDEDVDEHYDLAVQIVTETKKASISSLQRRLKVGYNRAARMVEMMERQGIVSPPSGPRGDREVLVRGMGEDGPERS